MLTGCCHVFCLQPITKEKWNRTLSSGLYQSSAMSSTFLTACWLPIFISAKWNQTALWIDRSGTWFQSHIGKFEKKKLTKTVRILALFELSNKSDSKFLWPDSEIERLDN